MLARIRDRDPERDALRRALRAGLTLPVAAIVGIAIGFGTMASRTTVTLSGAIHGASEKLCDKVFAIAANLLECGVGDLELRDGHVGIVGVRDPYTIANIDLVTGWARQQVNERFGDSGYELHFAVYGRDAILGALGRLAAADHGVVATTARGS